MRPSYSPLSLSLSYLQPHPCSLHTVSAILSSVSPTSSHILAPDTLPPPYCPLSLLPPATSWLITHCLHHTVLCLSYLQPHPGSLHTASTIQSSVFPTYSHILAPYTLHPPYSPLSLLPPATSWLFTHCLRHTVLCLSYLQPHPGYLHTASAIQSSVSPTSCHILGTYTLPPPYSPLSLLPPATSWLFTHCLRHTVLCLSYLQRHPGYLNIASAIQSSVSPTSSHILGTYTLPPPYSPLSLLPPATSWLFTYCLHHTVLCLSYLQRHPGYLNIASTIQSSVSSTSSHILAPYTLPPPYSPLSLFPPALSWVLTHCLRHTVLCLSYLQPHPCSSYTASAIQSSVSPTSSHILVLHTLPPPYCPLSLLPPVTSLLFIHCFRHTVLCLSYLQPHPGYLHIVSAILSSMSPTSSHILAVHTLLPPNATCPYDGVSHHRLQHHRTFVDC